MCNEIKIKTCLFCQWRCVLVLLGSPTCMTHVHDYRNSMDFDTHSCQGRTRIVSHRLNAKHSHIGNCGTNNNSDNLNSVSNLGTDRFLRSIQEFVLLFYCCINTIIMLLPGIITAADIVFDKHVPFFFCFTVTPYVYIFLVYLDGTVIIRFCDR